MNSFSTLGAALAILAIPGEVFAAETQPQLEVASSEVAAIEEIQVIAQKRSENLQRVPIAVSVATEEDIANEHITSTEQLPALMPGLKVGNSAGSGLVYLRGIGQNSGAPGIVNPISTYIDGIYIGIARLGSSISTPYRRSLYSKGRKVRCSVATVHHR